MTRLVHMPGGFTLASRGRVRAHCSCGYCTTPRVDEVRAVVALDSEHGETQPTCELCGREHFRPVEILGSRLLRGGRDTP